MLDIVHTAKIKVRAVNQYRIDEVRQKKSVSMMALDAAIIGGIAFFAAWTGELDSSLIAGVKAFGGAFVIQFAFERKLRK